MPTMVDKEFEVELKRYNEKNKSTGIFYCSAHRSSKLCRCGKEILYRECGVMVTHLIWVQESRFKSDIFYH